MIIIGATIQAIRSARVMSPSVGADMLRRIISCDETRSVVRPVLDVDRRTMTVSSHHPTENASQLRATRSIDGPTYAQSDGSIRILKSTKLKASSTAGTP